MLNCICAEESRAPMPGSRMTREERLAELGLKGHLTSVKDRRMLGMDLTRAVLVRLALIPSDHACPQHQGASSCANSGLYLAELDLRLPPAGRKDI